MKKFILKLIIFILIITSLLVLLAEPVRQHNDTSMRWADFYKQSKDTNFDLIIMGTSHAFRGFDTRILEDELSINVYNMGMSAQVISQTYYDLIEVLKYETPKILLLDTLTFNRDELFKDREYFCYEEIASMRFSINKIRYLTDLFDFKNWINAIFPAIREHENFKRPEVIKQNIKYLLTGEHSASEGMYDGFTIDYSELSEENIQKYLDLEYKEMDFKITKQQEKYIDGIFEMCTKKGIQIILFNTPLPELALEKTNYKDMHKEIQHIADKYDVEFIDYNMLYNELGFNNTHFMDEFNPERHHLNTKGAQVTTNYMVTLLKEEY